MIFISNCTLKNVEKHHGFNQLNKKNEKIIINLFNKNDILNLLGPPSTIGSFNQDVWIYIEYKEKKQSIFKLGKTAVDINNILILEIDNMGLLAKKTFLDKDDMNELKFSESKTSVDYKKDKFIYNFLSSLRQKVNDPLGKRKPGDRRKKSN
jgi:outer membrane protein assembly factor BamE (lipoprotein component of BamABCDE complex)